MQTSAFNRLIRPKAPLQLALLGRALVAAVLGVSLRGVCPRGARQGRARVPRGLRFARAHPECRAA